MNVEPFTVDHYRRLTGENISAGACLNAIAGPAFALVEEGQVWAIGGVRVQGIGEAWALLAAGAENRPKTILRAAREVIGHCIASERLYHVYAEESSGHPTFLKHLGFVSPCNLFVR